MSEKNLDHKDRDYYEKLKLKSDIEEELLKTRLDLEEECINWTVALSQVSCGNPIGFDYISQQYGLTSRKTNVYKSLCSYDYKDMDALFNALDLEVPKEISLCIAQCLQGDIDGLVELIGYRIKAASEKGRERTLHSIMSVKTGFSKAQQEEFNSLKELITGRKIGYGKYSVL